MQTKASLIVASMIGIAFMGSLLVTPLYALYAKAFGFSETTLTLIYSVYVVGNLSALLFFGKFSDAIGRRRVGIPAIAIAILSAIVFAFAHGVASLFVGRTLSGFAVGLASGTGAAWLVDLFGNEHRAHATVVATTANMAGAALGPVLGGALAVFTPWPLVAPYIPYIALLIVTGVLLAFVPDKVRPQQHAFRDLLRPRLGVPREILAPFFVPATAAFVIFAFVGFYAGLIPTVLTREVHESSALAGALIVTEMFTLMAVTIVVTRDLRSHQSMLASLALMLPGIALLLWSQVSGSLVLLVIATAAGGIAAGLGFRASLEVVNDLAPPEHRAEVVSSYYVVVFAGNALPIIGVGIVTDLFNPTVASIAFGAMIALFAIAGLAASPTLTESATRPRTGRRA